jgi:hypothetical protein
MRLIFDSFCFVSFGLACAGSTLHAYQPESAAPAPQPAAVTPLPTSVPPDCCGVDTSGCALDCCGSSRQGWTAGFEAVFVKPRFDDNVAFTVMESDGASFENFTDHEFDYDLAVSPRVWLGYEAATGLGLRMQYWQFDQDANDAVASPPANGFGRITHPTFGLVDITTTIPTNSFSAASTLNVYAIDLEGTKRADFDSWWLVASGGLRYASTEQSYLAQLRNAAGNLRGEVDFQQQLEGVGPTVSLYAARNLFGNVAVFGMARGSLLYGDGETSLRAGEDLDLQQPFLTRRDTSREDLLPVGEMQLGVEWSPSWSGWQPFVRSALEGQVWDGVGNAVSEDGSLGFFGFTLGVGLTR